MVSDAAALALAAAPVPIQHLAHHCHSFLPRGTRNAYSLKNDGTSQMDWLLACTILDVTLPIDQRRILECP